MKRWLLAATVLLAGSFTPASADYVIIIANLGQTKDPLPQQPGQPGMPPGGMMPPGGQRPGPMGMGPMGFGGAAEESEAVPLYVTAVVEISEKLSPLQKAMLEGGRVINVTHKWGGPIRLTTNGEHIRLFVVSSQNNTLTDRFNGMSDKAFPKGIKEKPVPEAVLNLADWCLKHGLVGKPGESGKLELGKFGETMDQFAQDNPSNPAAVAYVKVKADMAKAAKNPENDSASVRFLRNPRTMTSDHYIAYFNSKHEDPPEVKSRLAKLENAFKSYYFWFALRGVVLPLPAERLPTIVTFDDAEYKQLSALVAPNSIVADGFVARRDGVSVFSAKRLDKQYDALEKSTAPYWTQYGVNRAEVIKSLDAAFPKQLQDFNTKANLQTRALLMRVMEHDAELASSSHVGTRQLLYASGLLPRGILVPEWVEFGMGSFFETPLGSPWVTTGMAHNDFLPMFKELKKAKRLGSTPAETLKQVVTNGYFRDAEKSSDPISLQRARATAWALMYYLGDFNTLGGQRANLDGMQRFYKELAKMPRDLELDDMALLTCFSKAFGLLDDNNKVDINAPKFQEFAMKWDKYLDQEVLELQAIVDGIHEKTKFADIKENDKTKEDGQVGTAKGGPYHPVEDQATISTGAPMGPMGRPGRGGPGYPPMGPGGMGPGGLKQGMRPRMP